MTTATNDAALVFAPGVVLGRKYRLIRVLGAGGMGAVYEAENTDLGLRVAIKVMRGEIAANGDAIARFLREARATVPIKHDNIVAVLDAGTDEESGALYMVQELLAGRDLGRLLDERGRLPVREAVETLVPVLDALALAHRSGVVHRDLKPDNIFLAQRAESNRVVPKLIDFGISKARTAGADDLGLTRTGTLLGTPYYMSPEQAQGLKTLDHRTDLWAMGVILYEALAGRRPFQADNYNALLIKIVTTTAPALTDAAPEVPADLAAIVHHALERDPNARFQSAESLRDALLTCPSLVSQPWHQRLVARIHPDADGGFATGDSGAWSMAPQPHASATPSTPAPFGAMVPPSVASSAPGTAMGWTALAPTSLSGAGPAAPGAARRSRGGAIAIGLGALVLVAGGAAALLHARGTNEPRVAPATARPTEPAVTAPTAPTAPSTNAAIAAPPPAPPGAPATAPATSPTATGADTPAPAGADADGRHASHRGAHRGHGGSGSGSHPAAGRGAARTTAGGASHIQTRW